LIETIRFSIPVANLPDMLGICQSQASGAKISDVFSDLLIVPCFNGYLPFLHLIQLKTLILLLNIISILFVMDRFVRNEIL